MMERRTFPQIVLILLVSICSCFCNTVEYHIQEQLPENTSIGNVIEDSKMTTVSARSDIRYSLLWQPVQDFAFYFKINERTSSLSTAVVIDRETVCRFMNECTFLLKVSAKSSLDSFFQTIPVTIFIEDVNDNRPTFAKPNVELPISEGVLVGTSFTIEGATDEDTSEKFSLKLYELEPKSSPFNIQFVKNLDGSSIIKLLVSQELDREKVAHYDLTIIAKDGGEPPLTGTLSLNVTITDINDNYPKFNATIFNVTVNEDKPVGSVVVRVTATDFDEGKNGEVRYKLSPHQSTDILESFSINETSGEITIAKILVYYFGRVYTLIIEAYDLSDQPLTSQTFVTVNVLDTGNSSPEINVNLLPSPDAAKISEYANIGAVVAHVAVTDDDTGRNGEVTCSLQSNWFGLQRYDVNEYKVIVSKSLDRELRESHILTVECHDNGSPPLSSSSSFEVQILDENDNPPRFTQQVYYTSIAENSEVGTSITKVEAFDLDIGVNKQISYLVDTANTNYVIIDSLTGTVIANRRFDREKESNITIKILAVDKGNPSLTGSTVVIVTILDQNDEKPKFDTSDIRLWIKENLAAGSEVGRLSATDADQGKNAILNFSLHLDYKGVVPFTVFADGLIIAERSLDREKQDVYYLKVVATDNGDPKLSTVANTTIFVEDDNDNWPEIHFPKEGNDTLYVPYLTSPGSVVGSILATDSDSGENCKLKFEFGDGNASNIFSINSVTGDIYLQLQISNPQHISKTFLVKVHVSDMGMVPKSSVATLKVVVVSQNGTTLPSQETERQNFLIAVCVATITIVLSAGIIVTICILRRLDSRKRTNNYDKRNRAKLDSMFDKGPSVFSVPSNSSLYSERKHKETTFLAENGNLKEAMLNGEITDAQVGHEVLCLEPLYPGDVPSKIDDAPSETSHDSGTGDSGKGGSDEDLQNTSLNRVRSQNSEESGLPFRQWSYSSQQSQPTQLQSFSPRYQQPSSSSSSQSSFVPQQKIIPFSFKKVPPYPKTSRTLNVSLGMGPPHYDDDSSKSSGFQSFDGSLSVEGVKMDVSSDIVV
ncbi:hypothetical protein CHS0354_000948 [Potamilus streckersoni]|uniref:Cadherin domain-containing protein n=1 Tax=Potamilus streckersoni TaxID=2493646 RepID=A0AAE0SR69_9BIVA|nr:hypothetical protein CHS0354_000948 [Potamilus streckersoni]